MNFCNSYAVVSFDTSFLIQKGDCPTQAIQGQLLNQLIRDGSGKGFYEYDNFLTYYDEKAEPTAVFMQKYLPNSIVDPTIITKGNVEERYDIALKGVLDVANLVRSHYKTIELNLGAGMFVMTNELGEVMNIKFDVTNAQTKQLKRLLSGSSVSGEITMATIEIPKSIHSLLNLFKHSLSVYVKKRKVIFKSGSLYLVFGR